MIWSLLACTNNSGDMSGSRKTPIKILVIFGFLLLAAGIAVKTGIARQAFFELFAVVKRVEVLGPTVVRIPPLKSPYQHWLERAKTEIPIHEALVINDVTSIELQPERYRKAHRHSSDAFILLLSGSGYSLAWPEGNYHKRQRIDWQAGTLFAPPTYWYHQHLNSGPTPARYLAINVPELVINLGLRFEDDLNVTLNEVTKEWEQELTKQRKKQKD